MLGCRLAGAKCRGSLFCLHAGSAEVLPAVARSAEVLHSLEVQMQQWLLEVQRFCLQLLAVQRFGQSAAEVLPAVARSVEILPAVARSAEILPAVARRVERFCIWAKCRGSAFGRSADVGGGVLLYTQIFPLLACFVVESLQLRAESLGAQRLFDRLARIFIIGSARMLYM